MLKLNKSLWRRYNPIIFSLFCCFYQSWSDIDFLPWWSKNLIRFVFGEGGGLDEVIDRRTLSNNSLLAGALLPIDPDWSENFVQYFQWSRTKNWLSYTPDTARRCTTKGYQNVKAKVLFKLNTSDFCPE